DMPDPGFEPIGGKARKLNRKQAPQQPPGEEVAVLEVPLADAPAELSVETEPQTQPTLPPEAPEMTAPAEPAAGASNPDLFEEPVIADAPKADVATEPAAAPVQELATEPVSEPIAEPATETPAVVEHPVIPKRDSKHYSRMGNHEDSEEDRHSVRDIRVAPAQELPEPVKHEPLLTPIRSNSHYSRFGSHEDSEEDRHSVRDIRPTRIDVVLIPGRDAAQAKASEPAAPASPIATEPVTPVVPAQENPADNLTLPPAEAAPVEAAPLAETPFEPTPAAPRRNPDLFATEQPVMETEPVDEGPAPPVLIAPEPTVAPTIVEKPLRKSPEYHGPVLSTDGVDHEAHQEEDIFSNTKRKKPLLSDLPPEMPMAATRVAPPVPVLSTDAVDHEAHQEEDIFSNTKRKKPLLGDLPPEVPAESPPAPRGRPVDAEAETETEPRVARRTTPRVIQDYDEGRPAADVQVPESEVIPMAVPDTTQQRGPERITVPDSMPPVIPMEPVEQPTEPRGRQESSFSVPSPTNARPETTAPRLVMAITGPKQAPVGTQVVWHFKIQNLGSAVATGIVVSDVLPPGLQHRLSPDLEYTIPRLEPGEERETNLTVQCVAAGTITNRAVLRADGDLSTEAEIQIQVSGSSGMSPTSAAKSPLTVTHHGPERWLVDSTGQFLVTVTNTSSERQKNVSITQSYPKGTNLVHATVGHKVDTTNRTVTWTIPDFAPGAAYVLETELHSVASGPATSIVSVKVGESKVTEDRWTAISFSGAGRP
ncbi:MAG: hypothetical protein V4719_22405, partial [Planctomycetota bacterium]